MNPVIVIPTFVSARRRKDGGSILTTYDHMTPISQPGEARPVPQVAAEGARHRPDSRAGCQRAHHREPSGGKSAGHGVPVPRTQRRGGGRAGAGPHPAAHGAAGSGQAGKGSGPVRVRSHSQPGAAGRGHARLRRGGVLGRRRSGGRPRLPAARRVRAGKTHQKGHPYPGQDRLLLQFRRIVPVEKPGQVVQPFLAAGQGVQQVDHEGHARPTPVPFKPCVRRLPGAAQRSFQARVVRPVDPSGRRLGLLA